MRWLVTTYHIYNERVIEKIETQTMDTMFINYLEDQFENENYIREEKHNIKTYYKTLSQYKHEIKIMKI